VFPEGPVESWVSADEIIDEISNVHNLVHFTQEFGGDALFLFCVFLFRPNPPQ
jgi:hypothetical protein